MDVQVSEVRDMSKKSRLTGWAGGARNFSRLVLVTLLLTAMTLVGGLGLRDAQAAVAGSSLTIGQSSTDANSYATASITPGANRLILAWVENNKATAADLPTLSGNGLTWVQVSTVTFNTIATGFNRLTLFRAMGAAPTAGAVTISFAGVTQTACLWSIVEFSGVDTSGTNGSGAVVQSVTNRADAAAAVTGLTVTLGAVGTYNGAASGFGLDTNTAVTPRAGWTETAADVGTTTPVSRIETQWIAAANATASATTTGVADWGGIAVEIKVAPPAVTSLGTTSGGLGQTLNVTINGAEFTSGAGLSSNFGAGITVNSTTFVNATQLTANITISGGAALGARNVVVTNPDGQTGTLTSGFTVTNRNDLVTGTVSAVQQTNTSIRVTAPYTYDTNGNSTYTVDYKLSASGTWTNFVTNADDVDNTSPYVVDVTGLTTGSSYDIRVTYADADTVSGTNPQTVSGMTLVNWADSNLLHNSNRFPASTKWTAQGGWGKPGAKYGPFTCETCHAKGTGNIKRIKKVLTAPAGQFPLQADASPPAGNWDITFLDARGGTSHFGSDDPADRTANESKRICNACHSYDLTQASGVKFQAYVMATNPGHYNKQDCTTCHQHREGFKPIVNSCGACHADEMTTNGHAAHVQKKGGIIEDDLTDCIACHGAAVASYTNTGGHANHQDGNADFAAGIADGGTLHNQTCTAACHATTSGKAAQWSATSLACDTCHANPPANGGSGTGHAKHIAAGLTCATCHVTTPADTVHINDLNVAGDNEQTILADMGAAVNDEANVVVTTWSDANNTCANTACHNPSNDGHIADWDVVAASTCHLCHGYDVASGDPMASAGHPSHINNAIEIGDDIACTACHPNNVSMAHLSGALTVNAGLNYNGEVVLPNTAYGTCASLNCHYDPSGEDGTNTIVQSDIWNVSVPNPCNICHESPSAYGDHHAHFSAGRVAAGMTCYSCHPNTMFSAASNTRIKAGSQHLNGSKIDVAQGGNYNAVAVTLTYGSAPDPSSCTANCHQTGNPKTWEAVSSCEGCHGTLSTVGGAHALHIDITGGIDADRSECSICHGDVSGYTLAEGGNHQNGITNLVAGITNTTCTAACHASTAGDGSWADTALNCDSCHAYPMIDGAHNLHIVNSGMACSDCHGTVDAAGAALTHMHAKDIGTVGTNQAEWLQSRGKDYLNPSGLDINVDDSAFNNAGGSTWINSANLTDAGNSCSAVYCHDPSNTNRRADWDDDSASCALCHGDDQVGTQIATGSHTQHLSAQAKFGVAIGCTQCHPNNAGNYDHFIGVVGADTLAKLNKSVKFGGVITTQYQGEVNLPSSGFGTCTANTCHNNGQGANAITAFTWGSVVASDCQFCHDDPPTSGKHGSHLGTSVTYGPYGGVASTNCADCHAANNNLTMTGFATHMNGVVNFDDGRNTPVNVSTVDGIVTDTLITSCNNCHGGLTAANLAGGAKQVWFTGGARVACETCHGDYTLANSKADASGVIAPSRAGAAFDASGHGKAGVVKLCNDCHDNTVTHISAALGDTDRLDPQGGKNFGVLAEKNDYCLSCHTVKTLLGHYANTKTLGGTSTDALYCASCHDPHGQSGQDAMIAGSIAGQTVSGFTNRTQRTSYANGTFTGICQVCHDPTEVLYFNRTTNSEPTHKGTTNCIACHSHTEGAFAPSGCSGCHGGGTVVGANANYWPDSSNVNAENTAGRHVKHMEQLALRKYSETVTQLLTDNTAGNPGLSSDAKQKVLCAYCHATPGTDADHSNALPAEVGLVAANTGMSNLWNGASDANATWAAGVNNGNCSNTNCHNNQTTPAGFGWYGPNASACTMCHVAGTLNDLVNNNIHPNSGLHKVVNTSTVQAHNHTLVGPPGSSGCTSCHLSSANAPLTHINGAAVADSGTNTATERFLKHGSTAGDAFFYTEGPVNQSSCGSTVGLIAGCHTDLGNWKRLWSTDADSTATTLGSNRCNVCHGQLPGGSSLGWRDGYNVGYQMSGTTGIGHNRTNINTSANHNNCEYCHVAPAGPYNSYSYALNHENGLVETNSGAGVGYDAPTGSCTNFCHPSGSTKTMAGSTIWNNVDNLGASPTCAECHDSTGGALLAPYNTETATRKSFGGGAHDKHVNGAATVYADTGNNSTAALHNYGCANCHPNDINFHFNGRIDVTLTNTDTGPMKSQNNTAADPTYTLNNAANNWTISGGGVVASGSTIAARNFTCSVAYCHSDGKGAFKVSPDWYGGAFTGDPCANCHLNSPVGTSHNLNNVGIHYNNVYTGAANVVKDSSSRQNAHGVSATSTSISCQICHNETVTDNVNAANTVCATCHSDTNTPATGNESITIANKSKHVGGTVDVKFYEAGSIFSRAQLRPKSNTGVPDDVGADTDEVYNNWKRVNGYKTGGTGPNYFDGPSHDESWDTLGSNLARPLNTATDYAPASKNCTVACHNMVEIGWGSTTSKCSNCHTQLPK